MTVDGEVRAGTGQRVGRPPKTHSDPGPAAGPVPVSRATILAYATVAVLLTIWFLFGWLVQQQGFISSVGEALGAAFTLLLIVSVVGTVRRSRR